jgi:hypothetical protein
MFGMFILVYIPAESLRCFEYIGRVSKSVTTIRLNQSDGMDGMEKGYDDGQAEDPGIPGHYVAKNVPIVWLCS